MTDKPNAEKGRANDALTLDRLLRHFKSVVDLGDAALSVEPVANWSMNADKSNAPASTRAEIWDLYAYYHAQLFPVRTSWYFDTKLEFAEPSEMARQIVVNRSYDPNEFHLLDQVMKKGMTFVDVGSNFGAYTVFASKKVGATGKVIAFEPSRRELLALHRNVDLNRLLNVHIYSVAVADTNGTALLSVAEAHYSGHNRLGELAVFATIPTLRVSTDLQHYHWAGLKNGVTEIAIGKAASLEILVYGDDGFEFSIQRVDVRPTAGLIGPWRVASEGERALEIPPEVGDAFARYHTQAYGDIRTGDGAGLSLRGFGKAGVAFRCLLDPAHEYTLVIEGHGNSDPHVEQYPVHVVGLDEFLLGQEFKSIDVVKMDIEGSEARALRGAARLIEMYRPLLLIEISDAALLNYGATPAELRDFLAARGYILFDVVLGKPRLIDLTGNHSSNVVAVPDRFLDQVLSLGGLDRSALTAGLTTDASPTPDSHHASQASDALQVATP